MAGREGGDDEERQQASRLRVPTTTTTHPSYLTNQSRRTTNGSQRPQNTASRSNNAVRQSRRPDFSLSGNTAFQHQGSFVDPGYHALNPNYRKKKDAPLWGLAKPLPRVIRPGMKRKGENSDVVEDRKAKIDEPGSSEAIPQVGMIHDQREDAGLQAKTFDSSRDRGYGNQGRQPAPNDLSRAGTARTDFSARSGTARTNVSTRPGDPMDQYGSPKEEIHDPMDDWRNPTPLLAEDDQGDIGNKELRRLSSVKEESETNLSVPSRLRSISHYSSLKDEYDLEAGDDDWPLSDDEAERLMDEENDNHNQWASFRARFREPLAECLATCVAVLIGLCTNLSVKTSSQTAGSYFSQNWGWGLGITIGIYIAGGISGGHLNPAISLMLSLYRGFPIRKALIYSTAQVFGAFIAGLIAYGVYRDAITDFDSPANLVEGGTGAAIYTQPAAFATSTTAFFNEFTATAILSCAVLALGDDSNAPPGAGMHAFIVGLLVTALTMAFGYDTGACLNPARDFGPRLAAAAVGYTRQVWVEGNVWWLWGAWGATISGALLGGLVYDAAVFVGGESPVNYPRGRRKKAERKAKEKARWRWNVFKRGVKGEMGKK